MTAENLGADPPMALVQLRFNEAAADDRGKRNRIARPNWTASGLQ